MKIALITYPMETNPAGIGVNVRNIVENLIKLDQHNSYFLLHFTPSSNPIYDDNEILYKYFKYVPVMFSDSWYLYKNSHRFDIVHRFSPGGFIFKIKSKIVVTVNDLFLYKMYHFNRKPSNILARYFNRSSLLRADAIIAISHYTKEDIINTFNIDSARIHVVYCAPNSFIDTDRNGREILQTEYGINGKYMLFVSTIEPRKNLLGLVKAYEILKQKYSIDESLVVVGKKGRAYNKTIKYIGKSKCKDHIRIVGFVPTVHMGYFYRHASLFVYPSFMEGFGIPPLEAIKCGCPTLTSNTSSLPEIIQHDDMMFDPENMSEIVSKCLRILQSSDFKADNLQKGSELVDRFSWEKSAKTLIRIYNDL